MNRLKISSQFLLYIFFPAFCFAQISLSNTGNKNSHFPIIDNAVLATVIYDTSENILVKKAATFFTEDVEKVSGKKLQLLTTENALTPNIIIVGTIGNN